MKKIYFAPAMKYSGFEIEPTLQSLSKVTVNSGPGDGTTPPPIEMGGEQPGGTVGFSKDRFYSNYEDF